MLALAVHTKAPVAVDFTKLVELVNKVKVSGETKVTMTGLGDKPVALKHAVRSFAEKGGKLEKNTHGREAGSHETLIAVVQVGYSQSSKDTNTRRACPTCTTT